MALFMLVAISLTPFVVSAGELQVTNTYSATAPTFGNDKQEVSNPEHDDEDKRVINVTSTITLLNNESMPLEITGISFSDNQYGLTESDFELLSSGVTINNGTSNDLSIKATMPSTLDSINSNFEEVAMYVGRLTFNTNDTVTASFDVYMQRENKLILSDLDALINSKDTESNIDDGDDIPDLKPGDDIELTIQVESDYTSKDDLDIEDVEIDIVCDDDGDLDFDDDNVDVGDLSPKDESDETISFKIEDDADDNTITCELTLDGTDQNGAKHGEMITFDVEVKRESHDIVIQEVRLNPTALTCDDSSLQISVDMANLGKRDEDEVAIDVQSMALGISERLTNLVLDVDDTTVETFVVSVSPEELVEGKYAILVSTFYDQSKQTDSQVVQIDNLCTENSFEETQEEEEFTGTYTSTIDLSESTISATNDKLVSVKVDLTNRENTPVDYIVSLEDLEGFATSTSSKTVHLNPGQTSSVFLNLKTNEDVEEGAAYTASIVLKSANTGSILETETFTVNIEESTGSTGISFSGLEGENSKAFLIILNVVLIIIAIFLIKLIFGSGKKKKSKTKKVADFEPKSVVIKKKK